MPESRTIHLTNIYCSLDYKNIEADIQSQLLKECENMSAKKKDGAKALSVPFTVSLSNTRNASAYPRLSRSSPQQKHPYRPRHRNIHPDSLYCTGVLISTQPDQEGNKLQEQKILISYILFIIIIGGILVLFIYI